MDVAPSMPLTFGRHLLALLSVLGLRQHGSRQTSLLPGGQHTLAFFTNCVAHETGSVVRGALVIKAKMARS